MPSFGLFSAQGEPIKRYLFAILRREDSSKEGPLMSYFVQNEPIKKRLLAIALREDSSK